MKKYECNCCNYVTVKQYNMNRHLSSIQHQRKYEYINSKNEYINSKNEYILSNDEYINSKDEYNQSKKTALKYDDSVDKKSKKTKNPVCKFCNKILSSRTSRYRHERYHCKHRSNQNNQTNNYIENQNITNNIGTQNNIQTQNNNTINVLNFNDTDTDFLTDKDIIKCLLQTNHCVKALIENTHINPEKPENMNMRVNSLNTKTMEVFRDSKWRTCITNDHLDVLYDLSELQLHNWNEENNGRHDRASRCWERYQKNKDEQPDLIPKIKLLIKYMLYDNRDVIKKKRQSDAHKYIVETCR